MKKRRLERYFYPIAGVLTVLIGMLPYFVLQGKCSVSVRDELDGELVAYILGAKYLFSGTDIYPEFLGGMQKQALTPPSFLTLLLFKFFSPIWAYIINRLLLMLVAFIGMYLWLYELTGKRYIGFAVGVLFAFLPYFSLYGITVAGLPLVFYSFYKMVKKTDQGIFNILLLYFLTAVYGFGSSLVLCGYAVLTVLGIGFIVILFVKKKRNIARKNIWFYFIGIIELTLIYIIQNHDLLMQILSPEGSYTSHKTESMVIATSFASIFRELMINGSVSVPSLHKYILFEAVICIVFFTLYMIVSKGGMQAQEKDTFKSIIFFVLVSALIAGISGLRGTEVLAGYLNRLGGAMKTFQFDRFYWLYPFIWYSVLGLMGSLLIATIRRYHIGMIVYILFLVPTGVMLLKESPFKENAMEFVRDNSTALTWDAFFCEDEYDEISEYIENETMLAQDSYRVGSLGIEPSVALFSGFCTIDGYSNNYDVEYKHRFRRIIAKELEKNSYNREYFDNWGNRCYLFSSEYYGNPLLSKYEHPYFENLELDTDALKDLDCRYLISAGMIEGAEEKGFRLCRIFDSPEYTYVIYLYEIL